MKKTLLTLLALAACVAAHAEWTAVAENDAHTSYVDHATIKRSGNTVRFWMLKDFVKPTPFPGRPSYRSGRSMMVINCAEETHKTTYVTLLAGQMGAGEVVGSRDSSDTARMQPIAPGTIAAHVMAVVCER